MVQPKPYAIRVIVHMADGSTAEQPYVRPTSSRMGRETFDSMALGRLLRMLSEWDDTRGMAILGWTIYEVNPDTLR